MVEIIRADLHDSRHGEALIALLDEYARDEMGGGTALADEVKANLARALADRPGAHVLLAWVDGEPAGVATCFEGFSTFACQPLLNLHDLAVHPAHRGRGIGKRLLAEVERLGRELGCCKLTLEVLEGNRVAQAAYRASGFAGYELTPEVGRALFWQKTLG
ncbi:MULTISPECIES: GNAT family N-acetyltransferase [Aeromonas]|uniref:GNAT family N-acetyltransferase n=1 Tax=Aeromonas TaxID=642 RepID=UPI001B3282AD|nr:MULTISPECIES: GNAT family N-acetyltransferase [Aeromonas]MBP4041655.1 GNAT family N-acetyltransferase [Aeromonas sp. SrichE-2G]